MVTARNSLDKLTAGVSTRANLLTYFNSNIDIIDAALAKCNFVAAADPGVGDDDGDGYAAGSLWFNTTGHKIFVCEDATTGSALWRQIYPDAHVGDLVGPAGATDGNIPLFDGATGKLLKDSIYTPASFAVAAKGVTNGDSHDHNGGDGAAIVAAATSFSATAKVLGRKTASAGAGEECSITEILDLLGTAERGDVLYRGASAWAMLPHGTAGQVLQSGGNGADPSWADTSAASTDEWIAAGETWTYATATTFVITGDKSAKYYPGMRLKLTQTTPKYFIVVAVGVSTDTTITVYGGSDYTLDDAAITSPYYSTAKTPAGFPADPAKWTIETTSTSEDSQASPTASTIYNLGSRSIALPIGKWRVSYSVLGKAVASALTMDLRAGLSTANNSFSEPRYVRVRRFYIATDGQTSLDMADELISCAAATTYYLNGMTPISSVTSISWLGSTQTTVIKAVCAYL